MSELLQSNLRVAEADACVSLLTSVYQELFEKQWRAHSGKHLVIKGLILARSFIEGGARRRRLAVEHLWRGIHACHCSKHRAQLFGRLCVRGCCFPFYLRPYALSAATS